VTGPAIRVVRPQFAQSVRHGAATDGAGNDNCLSNNMACDTAEGQATVFWDTSYGNYIVSLVRVHNCSRCSCPGHPAFCACRQPTLHHTPQQAWSLLRACWSRPHAVVGRERALVCSKSGARSTCVGVSGLSLESVCHIQPHQHKAVETHRNSPDVEHVHRAITPPCQTFHYSITKLEWARGVLEGGGPKGNPAQPHLHPYKQLHACHGPKI
jgi:hypothetical protein